MKAFPENLAVWVSALGTFLSLLGALQSVTWLVWLGALLVVAAVSAAGYAWRQRMRLEAQGEALRYTLDLRFVGVRPEWVRMYELTSGRAKLVKDLKPHGENQDRVHYRDAAENAAANSVRVYMFERAVLAEHRNQPAASSEVMHGS